MREATTRHARLILLLGVGLAVSGCAGGAALAPSGYLTSYEGLAERQDTVRAAVFERRDEALVSGLDRLWIAPAELLGDVHPAVSDGEVRVVLAEVDRQVCYELSERFVLAPAPGEGVASVRVGVTRIHPTHPAGSAVAAAANFFIPGPINVRMPGGVGGLGAEAELLTPDGRQAAAIVWRRDAMVVGTDSPSLSEVGDAHQLAEPLADMLADAFTPDGRKTGPVPTPDPCERFGPRVRPEGFLFRVASGLYQPELSGSRTTDPSEPKDPT